jgi:hypothetical protein
MRKADHAGETDTYATCGKRKKAGPLSGNATPTFNGSN